MKNLIEELDYREWEYDFIDGHLHIIYRNGERIIINNDDAKLFMEEIKYDC